MLGMSKEFSPRFLRRYLDLDGMIRGAIGQYTQDVKSQSFPNEQEKY
jgi:3-methyl-2-oxobutanoate hydroxymethyltransferase